jgi:hypothetical protein
MSIHLRSVRNHFVLGLSLLLLSACGKPVPSEKAIYVGEWRHPTMYLLITQDGSVKYKRLKGGVTTSIQAPLKGFSGDDFEVGIGPIKTVFVVSKPPYPMDGKWVMVVDGVELTRVSTLQTPSN